MELRFHPSAFRHGVSRERIAYVIEHCGMPLDQPDEDGGDLVLYLGDDWNGVALEVVAVELNDGGLIAIHAMALRDKYADDYERVIPWQKP